MIKKLVMGLFSIFFIFNTGASLSARPLSMKVTGEGYFVLSAPNGAHLYSKDILIVRNLDGDWVTKDKRLNLIGRAISRDGTVSHQLGPINFANISMAPQGTHKISISANLDASTPVRKPSNMFFGYSSFESADKISDFSILIPGFDSLGNSRPVKIYFDHRGANRWDFHVLTQLSNLESHTGLETDTCVIQEGSVQFRPDGSFDSVGEAEFSTPLNMTGNLAPGERINPSFGIHWANGAEVVELGSGYNQFEVNLGQADSYAAIMTQFLAPTSVTAFDQDGNSMGSLVNLSVNRGRVTGSFSNGLTRELYEIPLATFPAEDFLWEISEGLFIDNYETGGPQISSSESSGRGSIIATYSN